MRAPLSIGVRRWWDGSLGAVGVALSLMATPVEWAYGAVVSVRNRRFDRRGGTSVEGVRVVSVGNLVVGGTGKTPVAAWTARFLAEQGAQVSIVARGYGRDELLLHRRWNPDIPMVADRDRIAAVRRARDDGAQVVVLDDGFQHRRLARDVDMVLVAAEDPYPGRLLPGGPWREPAAGLSRAHAVVVTRRTSSAEAAQRLARRIQADHGSLTVAVAALAPGAWQDLQGSPAAPPAGPTVAAAAVARPEAFAVQVAAASGNATELVLFADHHEYTEADVRGLRARAGERTLVVTEKDAVKLMSFGRLAEPVRVLTQDLRWEEGEDDVKKLLTSLCSREA